jgi:hypothetical protein
MSDKFLTILREATRLLREIEPDSNLLEAEALPEKSTGTSPDLEAFALGFLFTP